MIGLDLGSSSIKVCQVSEKEGKFRIVSAVMGANPLLTQSSHPEQKLSERIRAILQEAACSPEPAATSVGGPQILARDFHFPPLPPDELRGAVRLEAAQSIFSSLETMYTDFQLLTPGRKDSADVLFVGVPREIVDKHVRALESVGLQPSIVDIDNLAVANCYLAFDPNAGKETAVVLNVGYNYTSISILDSGELRFVRNVNFGGKDISAGIARAFEMTVGMAEVIKKRPELWPEIGINIKNILKRYMPDVLEAVYRSIEYCMSRKKIVNVDRILVTGGSSRLQGVEGFIAETLGIHTEKWNPLDFAETDGAANKDLGPFLSVALGLSIRKVHHA